MKNKFLIGLILTIFIISVAAYGFKEKVFSLSNKPIVFYVATDIHYLSKTLTDHNKAFQDFVTSGDGKQLRYIDELTDAFLDEVKKKKPDFLIISGDLTNNGEKASHVDLAKKLSIVSSLGIKVYVIPGNHDVFNPYARGFRGDEQYRTPYISDKDFVNIYKNFGYSSAISADTASLSYLAKASDKLWLLMLDTCKYNDNEVFGFPDPSGSLKPKTKEWIQKCSKLAKEKGAKILTVMHHNLVDHFEMLSKDYTIDDSDVVTKFFQQNKLNTTLSGHIHIQDIKNTKQKDSDLYDIVTSALSVYPHHYGALTYSEASGFTYQTNFVNVDAWAKATGQKDKNLLDFSKFSKDAFKKAAYDRSYNRLLGAGGYTEAKLKQMADTMAEVNLSIFSGTGKQDSKRILALPGFKLWQTSGSGFLKSYIENATNNKQADNNYIKIPASALK